MIAERPLDPAEIPVSGAPGDRVVQDGRPFEDDRRDRFGFPLVRVIVGRAAQGAVYGIQVTNPAKSRPPLTRHVTVATKPFGRGCGRISNDWHSKIRSG